MPDPVVTQDLPFEADRAVDRPAAPPSAETPMEPPPAPPTSHQPRAKPEAKVNPTFAGPGESTWALPVGSCPASTIFAGWRQSVLPVHLLGLAPLLGSVGPVAGDVKLQDDGVVHDPVNRRGGGHGVGKDALPL